MPDADRPVTNTERLARENPGALLAEGIVFGGSEAIEMSERAGQAELLHSDVLPVEARGVGDRDGDSEYIALGFVFGDPLDDDPIFRPATLPSGWTRSGSNHPMWSYIHDEEDFERVAVFYKAAFYDRNAHMYLIRVPTTVAQETALQLVADWQEGWRCAYDLDVINDDRSVTRTWDNSERGLRRVARVDRTGVAASSEDSEWPDRVEHP